MKLTVKAFGSDYYHYDIGISGGKENTVKHGIKKNASKARRREAKKIIEAIVRKG